MTEAEYEQFKAAARLYCESSGVDPDELGPHGIRWARAAEELRDLHMRLWALRRCGHTVS